MSRRRSPFLPLVLSFIAAFLLAIVPLPPELAPWRPDWVTLVLVFWVMHAPMWVGVWTAVVLGVLLDILLATPLGIHGMALIAVVALARMTQRWAGIFSVRQTTALILFLVLVSRLITLTLLGLVDTSPPASLHLLPVLASALVWPTVLLSLRRWTQR
ncbi:rod shape-determining protein MreD [Perlucidibaca piscinae]|uniref:rod shape-determining protein MreD n=1 Tax=Perlucidibaca piscinae TaxID=392589 RepID=UPI0003B325FF|nr:rod shape-determining protein MreD [Perlucidibaca piscinae]